MKKVAKQLLKIGAVSLSPNEPYTWSSGIKSPIYCDNRVTMSYPVVREFIAEHLVDLIQKQFKEVELIAGTATAGIPHAAWVSHNLKLPMCYVRNKAKEHGKGKQIEGIAEQGAKVVVVEDLVSTGGSSLVAVQALREAGCEVLGVVGIFTYGLEEATAKFDEENIVLHTLSNYNELIKAAREKKVLSKQELFKLKKWHTNPYDESWLN